MRCHCISQSSHQQGAKVSISWGKEERNKPALSQAGGSPGALAQLCTTASSKSQGPTVTALLKGEKSQNCINLNFKKSD